MAAPDAEGREEEGAAPVASTAADLAKAGIAGKASLLALEGAPVPSGGVVEMVQGRRGVPLRLARWRADPGTTPRGTVFVLLGRADFIEKYLEVVADLRARGYAVVVHEPRGQGHSGRLIRGQNWGHVASFHDYVADLDTVIRVAKRPTDGLPLPKPYVLLGHSAGGTVALMASYRLQRDIDRIVAVAPLIGFSGIGMPGWMLGLVIGAARLAGLGRRPSRARPQPPELAFDGNPLTSDPVRFARIGAYLSADPGLVVGPPTFGWVKAARDAMLILHKPDLIARLTTPTLLFACGADRVVAPDAIERFGRLLPAGGTVLVPWARHELMMERDALRAEFWAAFDAFVAGGD